MDYPTLKSLFIDLGFTPDKIAPLLVLFLLGVFLVNKRINPIEKLAKNLEQFIIRFCGALQTGGDINKVESYQSGSALNITPKGLEIIEQIGFKGAVDNNLPFLFKYIDSLQLKTKLDIESASVGVIHYLVEIDKENEIFREVKQYLYNNPAYNIPEYFKATGLYLRDKYLSEHPEITQ